MQIDKLLITYSNGGQGDHGGSGGSATDITLTGLCPLCIPIPSLCFDGMLVSRWSDTRWRIWQGWTPSPLQEGLFDQSFIRCL